VVSHRSRNSLASGAPGGASGIGRAIVGALATEGADIGIVDREGAVAGHKRSAPSLLPGAGDIEREVGSSGVSNSSNVTFGILRVFWTDVNP
jgi:NAD(P)-dependent dehydrogenase (short-subunit alcohol dehydrogenase family)